LFNQLIPTTTKSSEKSSEATTTTIPAAAGSYLLLVLVNYSLLPLTADVVDHNHLGGIIGGGQNRMIGG
jgi:hypothetical protein